LVYVAAISCMYVYFYVLVCFTKKNLATLPCLLRLTFKLDIEKKFITGVASTQRH
jgi:hypothetical protein